MKKILQINEGLELGTVRPPMPELVPEDLPKAEAAAERIRKAIQQFV